MSDKTEFKAVLEAQIEEESHEKCACLIMIEGDFIGKVYELKEKITTLGRDESVELVLADLLVSRKHAMIEHRPDGFYFLDLGSTNGCTLNKGALTEPTRLDEGDKIGLGDVVFKFSFQDRHDAEYHAKLRNMAVKDGLTRIHNKRYFTEVLEKEFAFIRRNTVGLALILFDIDHFKAVNDTMGHVAGDYALKELAQLIEQEARGYDVFARYGGEEFVFMLKGSTLAAAVTFAERVRVAVDRHKFYFGEKEMKITISLGVAWWDGEDPVREAESLIEAADKHLYAAKHSGRNRVCHDPL